MFIGLNLLLCSTGILVCVHSCGGTIESVQLFKTSAQCDGDQSCEGEGCCTNKVVVAQLDLDGAMTPSLDFQNPALPLLAILPSAVLVLDYDSHDLESAVRRCGPLIVRPHSTMVMRC